MPNFLTQKVNQWLCIALLGLMCFWTVVYYLGHKVQAFGSGISTDTSGLYQ